MQLLLDVVSSVNIKRKKPWPKLAWLGQEQDDLYLLDGRRISQLYLPSGKTKKKITKLHNLMNDVCAMNVSQNGQYLCGALCDGKIFIWEKDKDKLQYISGLPKLFNDTDKGNTKNKIFLSSCGTMMLLMVGFKKLFLWQKNEKLFSGSDGQDISGAWSQIHHGEYTLPDQSNKETSVDGVFFSDDVVGSCGALSYVFNKGTDLTITGLTIKYLDQLSVTNLSHDLPNQDGETAPREVTENMKCSIKWRSRSRPLYGVTPATRVVKGRFVYVCRYSPDGQILAIVLNQKSAKDTRLMFSSTLHATATIVDLKCCGGSEESSGRIWWVSDIAWTHDSLLLIGLTRNGALFITSKLGEPINLVTSGCMMEMGPSLFLAIHPRITIRSFQENIPPDSSEISSGSERDAFHQKFSVAVHPSFPLLLCSDGYSVTLLQFNGKPDHAEMMTNLIEEVSLFLPTSDDHHEVPIMSDNLKKKTQDVSLTAAFLSRMGTSSEISSAASTLSTSGFGLAKNMEAGIVTFGETKGKTTSDVEVDKMTEQQKHGRARNLLLQALRIGVSCGPHWSKNMAVTMNLVIHTWSKLFWLLLEDESNSATLSDSNPFSNIFEFVHSVFEMFHWDMPYQHCLPWFSQFASCTVKSLVNSKWFGHQEIIDVCVRLLRMAEDSVKQTYTWLPVSNRTTVHLLGDTFSPLFDAVSIPTTSTLFSGNRPSVTMVTNNNLGCKLERSWMMLYNYICKVYQSNGRPKVDRGKDQIPDQQLVKSLCFVQRKLQEINSLRNLVAVNNYHSPLDLGEKLYLEGKPSHAVNLLRKSFDGRGKSTASRSLRSPLKPRLGITAPGMVAKETSTLSGVDVSFVQQDLSSKLTEDTDTLLTILHINLENYDLKSALSLVYSFINTNRHVILQDLLNTKARLEESSPIFPAVDHEGKVTSSSSSVIVLQLSRLMKYPLAWVVDNCALPLVQELARFMSCYFTNLPLTIPVPFQPTSCSDQLRKGETIDVKHLSQQRVTDAIAQQKLEAFWTADHTMELLVVSGLLGEAAWFANRLGDWKIAFLLSVTNDIHRKTQPDLYKLPRAHSYFPPAIEVSQPKLLMLTKIKMILQLEDNLVCDVRSDQGSINDENVVVSLHNALEASVVAGLDLVPVVVESLVTTLRQKISKLEWIVVQDFYLPAPPLYCPQPTRNEEEILGEEMLKETKLRDEIADVVQKILAIYRASTCFLLCAQEYCKHLVAHLNNDEIDALPTVIEELIASDTLHVDTSVDDSENTQSSCHFTPNYPESVMRVLRCFQEFCGLMWFLHARDEVALTSRAYSKVKQTLSVDQGEEHKQVVILKCEEALVWLRKLLPFSDFLSTTHILDGILTLLAELPLTYETVNLLAQYFHTTPPSLSLSTTEKLKRLTRKLRNFSGLMGMGNGESLSVLFQEKCEGRRKECQDTLRSPVQDGALHLEQVFEFCNTLAYQKDPAYLRFLDTFLLITVSKNISEGDREEVPLISPYNKWSELLEISTNEDQKEKTASTSKHSSHSTVGIQRSLSFQDVRRKPRTPLLSPDGADQNDRRPIHRSNSLTDVRRYQKGKLSDELQTLLPRLIWLKRWCSVEEGHKGNQGGNRSVSLLNVTTSQAAIRVQVPLRMLVNTLWLIENYYNDFVNAKGRCVKTNGFRVKRRRGKKSENAKKSHKKVAAAAAADDEAGAAAADDEAVGGAAAAATPDDEAVGAAVTAKMGAGSRSRSGQASFGKKGGAPSPGAGVTEGAEMAAAVWLTGEAASPCRAAETRASPCRAAETEAATAGAEGLLGEAAAAESATAATTGVSGKAEGTSSGAAETRAIRSAGTPAGATVTAAEEAASEHGGVGEEAVDGSLASNVFENNQVVQHKSLKRHYKRKKNPRMSPQKRINTNFARPVFNEKQDQPSIIVQDFDSGDALEDVPTTLKIKKNLFPSTSSVDSKWKGSGSIKEELSLLTFSPSSYSPLVSDGKGVSNNSSQSFRRSSREMIPSTDLDSESGVLVGHQLHFTDEKESLSSESLSIGQVRSDFVGLLEPIHVVNSTSSIETKQDEGKQHINSKKPDKRSVPQESSSCEPSDKLHASFLKRVIRSEMRKFIKSQQAQLKSQSSAVETTEDDILSETLSRDEKSSLLIKKKQNERIADRKKARNRLHRPSSSSRRKTSTRNKPEVRNGSSLSRDTSNTRSRPQEANDSSLSGDKTNMRDRPEEQNGSCSESSRKPLLAKDDRANHIVSDHPSSYPAQPMVHEHQIPTTPMNGWPFWYQAPFPVVPPWLWPNTAASKMSDDKGIQVCTERSAVLHGQDNHELASDTKEVESENKNVKETMDVVVEVPDTQKEDIKDTVNHVAVQTDTHNDSQDEIPKDNPGKEFTHDKQVPLLPPDKYDQNKDARDSAQEIRKEKDIFEEQHAFKEVRQSGNSRDATTHTPGVSQEKLSGQYFQEIKNGDHFGEFTIPILKIPPEVRSPTSSVLPFKIAWPDKTVETNTIDQLSEMPLLQLDDLKERSETKDFVPFPPPVTNVRNVESFPLLNLSTSNERGPNLRNFRFLEVPLNQNLEFPLLYLPEAEKDALRLSASVFVEKDKRTTSKKKSRPSDKKAAETMFMETRNETMNARARRRHLVKDSAVFRQSNVKSNQERKSSLPKQTSSESQSSGVAPRGTVITVQPVQNSASTNDATKKKKSSSKRRDKLRELNNIIRDLERDISDESDLVLSEVSDLLSQEVKYENFEKKSKLVTRDKTAVNSKYRSREETLESAVKITDKEFSHVDLKPSTISGLYKPSAVSARDIHSEIPTTVPEEPSTSDAKVGTVNILRLPVSIQTDAVVQAHQPHAHNDLPQSPRPLKTKEFSVQTDLNEVRREDSRSNVCDAGTNTNNTSVIKQDQPEKGVFPRLPPDVFLNLDVDSNARERNLPSSNEDKNTTEEAREESPRMFISVADIGQDAVRRQIQEQSVKLRSDNVEKKKHFESEAEQNFKGHEANILSPSPRVSVYPDSEILQPHEDVYKGDPTTVDAFSSLDLHSSGVYPVAFRVSTEKQAQKFSKERLSQRLQEMNEQFDVIDRLTSNMDRDLQRSNMLLRTIDNLTKVTEHVASEEKQIHVPNIVNQHDVFKNERKPVWQNPPWTNKPIEELTELVDNENAEIKKLDSFEAKSVDDSEVENMDHIEDTKDTRSDTGQESESNRESRRSSISNIPSEPRPREDTELPKSTTPRYDTSSSRGLSSVVAPDILNRSREKLKELLATSTTSSVADLRVRDKTPQKQQELKEWMTKKRKIRHREWTDKLNEQRQAEHNPFQSKSQAEEAVVSSKKIKRVEKERKDNRRAQKKEDVDERLMSAYDLINEMITEPVPKAPIITHDPTQTARRKNGGKDNNRYKDSRRVSGKQPRTKRKARKTNIGDVNLDRFDTQRMKTKETSLSGLNSLVNSQRDLHQTRNAPVYDYDIEDSGRHFITRKSYEKYQNKMSGSYDFERSISFGRNNMFDVKHSFDSRVDELLDDVSLAETLDERKLDHLDSLLSGDSELRELLNDVIIERDKPYHDLLTRNDDVISINSRVLSNGIAGNSENRLETRHQVERKGTMFGTFRVASHDQNQRTKYSAVNLLPDTESANNWNDVDNLEMSDEVAALLAEAKAAVGDDFSGTSEVGDIDWNEVDNVLQEN